MKYNMDSLNYLEISLVEYCNLNCKGCSHFSPLANKELMDINILKRDIIQLSKLFKNIKIIRLLGGEPLLHPEIENILDIVRYYFKKSHIQLLTNGLLLLEVSDSFVYKCRENKIDIHITIYPSKTDYKKIFSVLNNKGITYSISSNSLDKEKKFHHLAISEKGNKDKNSNFYNLCTCSKCTNLYNGKIYLCPVRTCIRHYIKYFGIDIKLSKNDYIDIFSENIKAKDIIEFISKPCDFCGYCDCINIRHNQKWELSLKKKIEWSIE